MALAHIRSAASYRQQVAKTQFSALLWTPHEQNPIKTSFPQWKVGDGQQPCCPFCLCRKDLFSSLSSRLALLGRRLKKKKKKFSSFTVFDTAKTWEASSRIEASSDSLFFILLGMFKTWDRRFFPFKIAKYLYKSFTIELLWVNQHHGQRRTAFRSSHLCILQKYLKISFRCLIKLDAAVAVGSDEAFLHIP